jgi:peptidoglycan/LPS O-acetylase OafA/YrhL
MYFYLLLPFVAMLLYGVARHLDLLKVGILLALATIWISIDSSKIILLYGQNHLMRAFFDVFLVGMSGSFLYYGIYKKNKSVRDYLDKISALVAIVGAASLGLLFFLSTNLTIAQHLDFVSKNQPIGTALLCTLTVICAAIGTKQNWFTSILSFTPLRYIGVIGYSFYLIHPYAIFMIQNAIEHYLLVPWNSVPHGLLALSAFALTAIIASMTYALIERPFLSRTVK